MYHPQTFSQWFIEAYPLTPFVCFVLYIISLVAIVCIGLVRWLVSGKHREWYVGMTDIFLLLIHGLVIVIESYKNFMEYIHSTHKENFCDEITRGLEVILIKADWCTSCETYLKSGVWEDIQKQVSSELVKFTVYDISTEDLNQISQKLNTDIKTVPYVPCIYIRTPEGIFMYQHDIYKTSEIVSLLNDQVSTFTS